MRIGFLHKAMLPLATAAAVGLAAPAAAVGLGDAGAARAVHLDDSWQHGNDRGKHKGWYKNRGRQSFYGSSSYGRQRYYDEPVYQRTRVWQGDDGRYYCRRSDGTTGLLIGAAVGGLAGRELAGRNDRTLGTVIGAGAGALLGRTIDRNNSRCR